MTYSTKGDPVSIFQINELLSRGSSLILDATEFSGYQLKEIAGRAAYSSGNITLKNSHRLSMFDMKEIASRGGSKVTFDFT